MTKTKWFWLIFVLAVTVAVVAFFVTSVVLADLHEVSLVTEWQTWFGLVKKATEDIPTTIETAKVIVVQPVKALIAC